MKSLFINWLRTLNPASYGGAGYGSTGLSTVVEYFVMAVEDNIFPGLEVECYPSIPSWTAIRRVVFQGRQYAVHPSVIGGTCGSMSDLFQAMLGVDPAKYSPWTVETMSGGIDLTSLESVAGWLEAQ